MLETLDTIPWATLEHAYGSAADVPDTLRMLISPDPETREKGYCTVYGNIFHQGTRYEATAYAVPFLFEMLRDANTPEREQLVALLTSLAMGYENEFLPFGVDPDEYFTSLEEEEAQELLLRARAAGVIYKDEDEDAAKDVDGLSDDEMEELHSVKIGFGMRDTYQAVEKQLPELVALLDDEDWAVRMLAAHALAWFPKRAADTLPALRRAYSHSESPVERANILPALGLLGRKSDDRSDVPLLLSLLAEEHPKIVRVTAAIALATLLESELPAEACALLTQAAEDESEHTDKEELPWNEGDLPGYAEMVLEALDQSPAE